MAERRTWIFIRTANAILSWLVASPELRAASQKVFFGLFELCFMPRKTSKMAFVTDQITPKCFDNLKFFNGRQVMTFGYVHNKEVPAVVIDYLEMLGNDKAVAQPCPAALRLNAILGLDCNSIDGLRTSAHPIALNVPAVIYRRFLKSHIQSLYLIIFRKNPNETI